MRTALFVVAFLVIIPVAYAEPLIRCEGTLNADSFKDERKQIQGELQKTILEYRKVEAKGGGTPEAQAQLAEIKKRIDQQKKTYEEFNSKYFPSTPVAAYGAACQDRRWLEEAKAKLVEKPELLGKQWYVWLDKDSRKPMASPTYPSPEGMAK